MYIPVYFVISLGNEIFINFSKKEEISVSSRKQRVGKEEGRLPRISFQGDVKCLIDGWEEINGEVSPTSSRTVQALIARRQSPL